MIVRIASILLYLLCSYVQANTDEHFLAAKHQLESLQRAHEDQLLFSSRNMQLKLYNGHRPCVAVVIHGLYQSPKDMQGLINYFFNEGCHVVAPLLAGHWRRDQEAFYKISSVTWRTEINEILNLSQHLGNEIILVGHSTGGLLALDQIINKKQLKFSHAILFAPAIKLQQSVILSSKFGAFFGLVQNSLTPKTNSEYDKQARPAVAGVLVQNLIESVFGTSDDTRNAAYAKIKTPVFFISTENDQTVRHDEIMKLASSNPRLFKILSYSKDKALFHDNIQRSVIDVEPNSPIEWTNPYFSDLLLQISGFVLSKNFSP